MTKFIEIEELNGTKTLINISDIVYVQESKTGYHVRIRTYFTIFITLKISNEEYRRLLTKLDIVS